MPDVTEITVAFPDPIIDTIEVSVPDSVIDVIEVGSQGGGSAASCITLESAIAYFFSQQAAVSFTAGSPLPASLSLNLGTAWTQSSEININENAAVTSISFPQVETLANASGWIIGNVANLASFSAPNLATMSSTSDSQIRFAPLLTSVLLPSLASIDGNGTIVSIENNNTMASVDLSALALIDNQGQVAVKNNPLLTSLNLSALATLGDTIILVLSGNGLTSVDISGITSIGPFADLEFNGNALPQAQINAILVKLAAVADAGSNDGYLDLSGGTNAAPSGAGLAAKATLQGLNWTVLNN